jgi:hypothetical protein
MADNAIEKLFEEIRLVKIEIDDASERYREANIAMNTALEDTKKAQERTRLLQSTLDKHIHEGLPVIQAKMVAHEECEAHPYRLQGNAMTQVSKIRRLAAARMMSP